MKACPKCKTQLPDDARFCLHCGAPQPVQAEKEPVIQIDWNQDPAQQITPLFFVALQHRIAAEYEADEVTVFSERVYQSGFRDMVQRRAQQIGDKLQTQLELGGLSTKTANSRLEWLLEELLDFFIIRYCKDLVQTVLPESILKYQGLGADQIDLFQMALDYLDFAHEQEIVYTDFLIMPVEKLKNAGRSFLFPEKNERIWLICDQSILGSCKEGFALTEKGIYWKAHLQKPRQALYANVQQVEKEKDWITINGHFFNVNAGLNLKMLQLLKKLRHLMNPG